MHPLLHKYSLTFIFIAVLAELIYAVYLDLKTAKFPNKLFLIYLGLNIVLALVFRGWNGLIQGSLPMIASIIPLACIYYARILGGGDIKLIFALTPLLTLGEFTGFLLMSFVWAGIFGLFRSLLGGNLRALLVNTLFSAKKVTVAEETMPFTIGILLGWCSYESIMAWVPL